ncbi:MAG: hypothetical protein FJ087_21455, partial [Deltaproteobacteria bacterium]|nr:hypothetical protein [Deltaproteobacteria bacterium]
MRRIPLILAASAVLAAAACGGKASRTIQTADAVDAAEANEATETEIDPGDEPGDVLLPDEIAAEDVPGEPGPDEGPEVAEPAPDAAG